MMLMNYVANSFVKTCFYYLDFGRNKVTVTAGVWEYINLLVYCWHVCYWSGRYCSTYGNWFSEAWEL